MWIVLRMVRRGDLDPGELFAGGAEFMHMTMRGHGIHVDDGQIT